MGMKEVGGEIFLDESEAAAMLQPFMPNKDARAWLSSDRRFNPVIPVSHFDGEIYYREADLVTFVRYSMRAKPLPRSLVRRRIEDRRQMTERRHGADRRKSLPPPAPI
jgi:hypothetical protein